MSIRRYLWQHEYGRDPLIERDKQTSETIFNPKTFMLERI